MQTPHFYILYPNLENSFHELEFINGFIKGIRATEYVVDRNGEIYTKRDEMANVRNSHASLKMYWKF